MLAVRSGDERPVDRQGEDLRAGERQSTGDLGELVVVADRDAEPADRGVEQRARARSPFEECRFRAPEMGLAVVADPPLPGEDGWVAAMPDESGSAVATLTLRSPGDKSLPPHNDLFGDRRPELY